MRFEYKYIWWISLYFPCTKNEFLNEDCRVHYPNEDWTDHCQWYRYFEGLGEISTKCETFGVDLSKYVEFAMFCCLMFTLHRVKHFLLVIIKTFWWQYRVSTQIRLSLIMTRGLSCIVFRFRYHAYFSSCFCPCVHPPSTCYPHGVSFIGY